jgi:hypothetical protein
MVLPIPCRQVCQSLIPVSFTENKSMNPLHGAMATIATDFMAVPTAMIKVLCASIIEAGGG